MGEIAGFDRRFVKAAMAVPLLAREEEQELAQRWRSVGDQAAMHKLATAHTRLAIAMAMRFRHYGLSAADLIQEGYVGLLEAAARFEPAREVRFSTYATWWIRASIQDYILRNWSIVRGGTSSNQKALFFSLRRLRAKLTRGGEERISETVYEAIAASIGVSRADVAMMDSRLSGSDISLNAPIGEDDGTGSERMDFLHDTAAMPDETVGARIDSERRLRWLQAALAALSERELTILHARKLSDETCTLDALGRRLGISKERVRQIESVALEKLRRALIAGQPQGAAALA